MSQMEVLKGSLGIIFLVSHTLMFQRVLFYIETKSIINVFNKEIIYFLSLGDGRNHTGFNALERILGTEQPVEISHQYLFPFWDVIL